MKFNPLSSRFPCGGRVFCRAAPKQRNFRDQAADDQIDAPTHFFLEGSETCPWMVWGEAPDFAVRVLFIKLLW
jgi:hypothetical protein